MGLEPPIMTYLLDSIHTVSNSSQLIFLIATLLKSLMANLPLSIYLLYNLLKLQTRLVAS